jgi:HEAT repeat protein/energy-coupling factor transporter ATP-binding protein EcfA2
MPNPDELIAILDRILNGSRDESEVAQLRQWLKVSGTTLQFVSQDGKINTNIGQVQGGEIHIGDRHYQVDVEALRELLQPTTPLPNIDWHAVSQAMLEDQLRLTTNLLTSGEGISYRTEQVYVPLGLVERKRQTRRREDVPPEQGSLLYEETEITQRFEHEQFLEQVLQQGQSPKSRGKRIAIIGEPGAGKTTLLQQIAQWVSEQVEGAIAIWVSLADLRGQELEPYLLEQWLQAVVRKLGQAEASGQVKDAFVALFQQGRVWLLLDGVDEMQVSSGNPLAEMSRHVRMGGLLSQARIVLSCRLNLWDGNRNALDTFDTYRTLEFSYPQQVEQFIGRWFGALSEGQGEQAERLCAALKAPGKERIRDLVKNPLRLTLLCFNWYLGEGTLPETKAGLYEQFVADFYEWKREQFPTTSEQRKQLNAALGELAREAIDKEETRFRLRHDFVVEFLGEPDESNSLFQLALQLGWLNKVGVDAENPRKAVYAFFHPTFEEYFAALAIDDWHFFLNHSPENPNYPDASYRVFEPQYKEVFLLWLGRENIQCQAKEDLLNALVDFDDRCCSFYKYLPYCLATSGIREYKAFPKGKYVITEVVKWKFGYLPVNFDKKTYICFFNPNPVEDIAEAALRETDRVLLISALLDLIERNKNGLFHKESLNFLKMLTPHDSRFVQILNNLLSREPDEETLKEIIENLELVESDSPGVQNQLADIIRSTENAKLRIQASEALLRISSGDSLEATRVLLDLLEQSKDDYLVQQISLVIKEFGLENRACQELLIGIDNSDSEERKLEFCRKLSQVEPKNLKLKLTLENIADATLSNEIRVNTIILLIGIGINNSKLIRALKELAESEDNLEIKRAAIFSLGELTRTTPEATKAIVELLRASQDTTTLVIASEMLSWHNCRNAETISALSQLIDTNHEPAVKYHGAECLGEIDPGNIKATGAFIKLLKEETSDEGIQVYAIDRLSKIGNGSQEAIFTLREIVDSNRSERVRLEAAWNLWLFSDFPQRQMYDFLVNQLSKSEDIRTIAEISLRLRYIVKEQLMPNLVNKLSSIAIQQTDDIQKLKIIYTNIIWCALKMPYLGFFNSLISLN